MPQAEGRSRPWRDHRQVVEGIVFRHRTGVAWRDLPERFGLGQTVWKRHRRFATDGTWDKLLRVIQAEADAAGRVDWSVSVDSSIVRAHQHSATAKRVVRGGSRAARRAHRGLGRIQQSALLQGRTGRSRSRQVARRAEHEDPRRGRRPWPPAGHPAHPGPGRRWSDDAATTRQPAGRATARATAHPARPCSGRQGLLLARDPHPPASPRDRQRDPRTRRPESAPQAPGITRPVTYDRNAYRGRSVIERALNGFKHRRGLATRCDKHATVYRGTPILAAALLWINA